MNPQPQQRQEQQQPTIERSPHPERSSSGLLKLILPGVGIVAVLFIVQYLLSSLANLSLSNKLNLKKAELNPTAAIAKKSQAEAPRYGLDDKTVKEEQVYIILRDNGYEDGDYVTLSVNGRVYAPKVFLRNAGNSVLVPLNPGANLVQIYGDRDGGGGITLAADVSTSGNISSSPFSPGETAMFYIIRR